MVTRKEPIPANAGRKSAYVARNHAALLKAAQKVLAEIGPSASIDQFAEGAEVSVSTIYKHFENKEALIAASFIAAFKDWENWTDAVLEENSDALSELVNPMRLFLRLAKTHPHYAAMIAKNIAEVPKYYSGTQDGFVIHVKELIKKKILVVDHLEVRIKIISASLLAGLAEQLTNPAAKESDADATIEVILEILGISPAKAKKIATGPLPELKEQQSAWVA
jgi:AcrR family transcriptional regulator